MTTRGPLPPAVYWRRRVFVLGTVVALVLLTVNLVRDDGDPAPSGDTAAQVAGEPSATPDGSERPGKNKDGRKRRNQGKGKNQEAGAEPAEVIAPPEPEPAVPTGPCDDTDVTITPSVPGAVAGTTVPITLTLQTVTAEACTWRLDADHLALKITDGADEVWASRECRRQVSPSTVVVRRELTATVTFPWNARYSSEGCPTRPTWADPGTYYVQAAALGGEPSDVVEFELLDGSQVVVPDGPLGPEVPGADEPDDGKGKGKGKSKSKNKPDGAVEPDGR